MKTITISDRISLEMPDGYQQVPLAGRDEWTAGLRSGKFKPGHARLCAITQGDTEPKYCCLGVLSKLQGRLTDVTTPIYGDLNGMCAGDDGDSVSVLAVDNPLRDILGNTAQLGQHDVRINQTIITYQTCVSLAELNDAGATFAEIADVIDAVYANDGPLHKTELGTVPA